MEVAPGVHRLEFAVGSKPMAMYLLAGDGLILIDSGLPDTPENVYLPAIRELGRRPEEVRLLLITHADADHIGGNHAARRLFPNAQIACHARDQRWASDPAVLTAERYDGFAPYGLRYDQAVFDMLASWMGPAEPMDLMLQGGERLRLTADEWLTVYHVPGHTPGHLCLYNPAHRYALIADAIFGRSQVDIDGGWSAPPPYTGVDAYRGTIQTLAALDVDLLLTCHYPIMRGDAVKRFIDASRQFVDLADDVTRQLLRDADGPLTLGDAIDRADPLLGPFAFVRDLQFALLAHLDHAVATGEAARGIREGMVVWTGRWLDERPPIPPIPLSPETRGKGGSRPPQSRGPCSPPSESGRVPSGWRLGVGAVRRLVDGATEVNMATPMRESAHGRLSGKVAVITGAAHGIGRASAVLFAREGAKVAIVDFDADGGAETERLVREVGNEAFFVQADVGQREEAERAIAATIARYGGVDVLFNNAGIMPEGTALTHSEADWDRVMEVNLKAIFLLSRAALPSLIARGGGSIVNTASVQGLRGHQNRLAYATSKHGVIGITRSLAADFARDGVRVNAICPGTIDTPMLHRVLADLSDREAALAEFAALHPLGVIGQPDDVAYAALYLASDESRFVTGIALPVDGGYTSLITHV